jgi:hypothetical protein
MGWVVDQRYTPAALPLRMTRYPLYRRLWGTEARIEISWTDRVSSEEVLRRVKEARNIR